MQPGHCNCTSTWTLLTLVTSPCARKWPSYFYSCSASSFTWCVHASPAHQCRRLHLLRLAPCSLLVVSRLVTQHLSCLKNVRRAQRSRVFLGPDRRLGGLQSCAARRPSSYFLPREGAPPLNPTPSRPLDRAGLHALPRAAHPNYRTCDAILMTCGEPRHAAASAHRPCHFVAPPGPVPSPTGTL